jgi:hypothetical protein
MSVEITAAGKIVGGHVMVQTLLPRVVDGDLIKLSFDGNDEFPERITATTPMDNWKNLIPWKTN